MKRIQAKCPLPPPLHSPCTHIIPVLEDVLKHPFKPRRPTEATLSLLSQTLATPVGLGTWSSTIGLGGLGISLQKSKNTLKISWYLNDYSNNILFSVKRWKNAKVVNMLRQDSVTPCPCHQLVSNLDSQNSFWVCVSDFKSTSMLT